MKNREWTILGIVAALVIVAIYTISDVVGSVDWTEIFKELIDNIAFIGLCGLLILALVLLPV